MASAAKRRRKEQEETLVTTTVQAVLAALEQRGVLQPQADKDDRRPPARVEPNPSEQDQNVQEDGEISENGDDSLVGQLLLGKTAAKKTPREQGRAIPADNDNELGELVPLKIKQAIWNDEFVEFSDLLKKHENRAFSFQVTQLGQLAIEEQSNKTNLSINQWISAFTIFMDIYVQKYSEHTSGMLVYMNTIRDLERVYGNRVAAYYDRKFRTKRLKHKIPWGELHLDSWSRATTLVARLDPGQDRRQQRLPNPCFAYNRVAGCQYNPCRFAHVCKSCRKSHPEYKCFAKARSMSAAQSPSPSPALNQTNNKGNAFRSYANKK